MSKRRTFKGLPLRDATLSLSLPLLDLDVDKATETLQGAGVNDPERFKACVVAEACHRVFGDEQEVRIMRQFAYRAMPKKGEALRYEISDNVRAIVEAFDRGEEIPDNPEAIIHFRPPSKSRTLASSRKYSKRFSRRHPGYKKNPLTDRKQRKSDPLAGQVRNGHYVKL